MDLKKYLSKEIQQKITHLNELVAQNKKSLKVIDKFNPDNAHYEVSLKSLWEKEGEKSTLTRYTGSLENAIKRAENEFKDVNKRTDIQADWLVQVKFERTRYVIPWEYWANYITK
jgi:hypothetical protein